jgi:UDP-2-acetamido-3-amino-2,3-dideoxy-glucuronate N-acetyltransferase
LIAGCISESLDGFRYPKINKLITSMSNLALIGGGYWGKNLARNFLQLNALHTICDPNPQTLQSYGNEYQDVKRVAKFEEVLADGAIQRVAIAAPASLHYKLAKQSLNAGKHVFVEKPLCLSISEGQELIALAEAKQRTLMVGHLLQYHPYVVKLREMVASGELGRLFYVTSNRLNLGKIRSEENALWSFAPHDISVILALAGGLPESIQCVGEHYLTRGVADTTLTQLKFSGGLKAHIYVSWMNPFKEQKLTVIGSEGMVVFDDTKPWNEKLVLFKDYLTWEQGQVPVAKKTESIAVVVAEAEPLRSECEHFLECCETGKVPRTDGNEGLRVLKVLDAAQQSLERQGEGVRVNAKPVESFFTHPTAIVDEGAVIGAGTKIWHFSHVSAGAKLGSKCNLGQNVFVADDVEIGSNVKIQNNVSIYGGTVIEDDVFLGPSCVLTNISNPRSEVVRRSIYETTSIKRGATIGANATIVCGVTLGRFAFVAAGAVVTKSIPDYALVKGNPARQAGWMSRHGHVLEFADTAVATCPESGLTYQLSMRDGVASVNCQDIAEEAPLPPEHRNGNVSYRQFQKRTTT